MGVTIAEAKHRNLKYKTPLVQITERGKRLNAVSTLYEKNSTSAWDSTDGSLKDYLLLKGKTLD